MQTMTRQFGIVVAIHHPHVGAFVIELADGRRFYVALLDSASFTSVMLPLKISFVSNTHQSLVYAEAIEIITDEQQEASPVGLRYTEGKLRADLIHPDFEQMVAEIMTENPGIRLDLIPKSMLREVGIVFTEGIEKYPPRNWEKGMPWSKVIGPLRRHWLKWCSGLKRDKELPSCHHLAQLIWNAAVLLEYETTHPEQDDRAKLWPGWKPKDSAQ